MPPPLQTYIPSIYASREYTDGVLRELYILRAEHSSAPTDHHRKYLCIIPEVCCEYTDGLLQELGILRAERSSAPTDHHRKNLCIIHKYVASILIVCCKS